VFEKLDEEHIPVDYKNILSRLEDREVTVEPVIQKYPLLQLYFRGIFGINARAEILLYLAFEEKGNSNQIAREIYYDQKIVYRILKRWTASGFTREEIQKKETLYFLKTGREFVKKIKCRGHYVNWCRVFYFFTRLLTFASTKPWAEDTYLLSSLFRDVSEEAARIGRYFNRMLLKTNLFRGDDLFSPFAAELMKMVKKMNK
jgi:DNA-binding MarR family transcriptional regulator